MSVAARRVLVVTGFVLLLPVVLLAGALVLVQSEQAEEFMEARIAAAIERDVQVEGIDIQLGWPPAVNVERLKISNPSWAKTPDLVDASNLHARVEIPPLLSRRLVIPYLRARSATAGLEQDGERATWRFGEGEEQRSPFDIKRVSLADGRIVYRDEGENTALDIAVQGSLGEGAQLDLQANGTFRGEPAKATARVPSLQPAPQVPIRIDARGTVGRTGIAAEGQFASDLETIDMRLHLEGPTLRTLDKVFRMKLPDTPPYSVRGQLRHTGAEWRFEGFEGTVGDSDLRGDVAYRTEGKQPFLQADLESKLLDFDDLGPIVGAPPKTGPGETATAEQKQKAAEQQEKAHVLPREAINTEHWKAMDADIKLEAKRILRPEQLPLDALATRIVLKDALLTFEPLTFGIADGQVKARIAMDARKDPLRASMDVDVQGISLARVFPRTQGVEPSLGTLYGRGKLSGRGASVAALLGTSEGQLSVAVDGGLVNLLLVELLGLDLAEAATLLGAGKRRTVELRCAVVDFSFKEGVAHPQIFIVDTTDTVVKVEGSVNFDQERYNLVSYPEPKDMSLFALRSPVQMQGTFKDPAIRPKAGPIVARGAAAAALAAANPLLALLPFIETGPGKDSDCGALLGGVKAKGAVKKQR